MKLVSFKMKISNLCILLLILSNALMATNLKKTKNFFGAHCFESQESEVSDAQGVCYTVSFACGCVEPVPIACSSRRGLRLCCKYDTNGWCAKNN